MATVYDHRYICWLLRTSIGDFPVDNQDNPSPDPRFDFPMVVVTRVTNPDETPGIDYDTHFCCRPMQYSIPWYIQQGPMQNFMFYQAWQTVFLQEIQLVRQDPWVFAMSYWQSASYHTLRQFMGDTVVPDGRPAYYYFYYQPIITVAGKLSDTYAFYQPPVVEFQKQPGVNTPYRGQEVTSTTYIAPNQSVGVTNFPSSIAVTGTVAVKNPIGADDTVIPLHIGTDMDTVINVGTAPGEKLSVDISTNLDTSQHLPVSIYHNFALEPTRVVNDYTELVSKDADGKEVRDRQYSSFFIEGTNVTTVGEKQVNAIWTTSTATPPAPASSVTIAGVAQGINIPVYTRCKDDPQQTGETQNKWIDVRTKDNITPKPGEPDFVKNIVSSLAPYRGPFPDRPITPEVDEPQFTPQSQVDRLLVDGSITGGIYDPFHAMVNQSYGKYVDKAFNPSVRVDYAGVDTIHGFDNAGLFGRCVPSLVINGNAETMREIQVWNVHATPVQGPSPSMVVASNTAPPGGAPMPIPLGGYPVSVSGPPHELPGDRWKWAPVRVSGKEFYQPTDVHDIVGNSPGPVWEPVWTSNRLFQSTDMLATAGSTKIEAQYVSGIPMEGSWRRWEDPLNPAAGLVNGGNQVYQGYYEPVRASGVNTGQPGHPVEDNLLEDSKSKSFEWRPVEVAAGYYTAAAAGGNLIRCKMPVRSTVGELHTDVNQVTSPVQIMNRPVVQNQVTPWQSAIKIVGADLGPTYGIGAVALLPGQTVKIDSSPEKPVHTETVVSASFNVDDTSDPIPVVLKTTKKQSRPHDPLADIEYDEDEET